MEIRFLRVSTCPSSMEYEKRMIELNERLVKVVYNRNVEERLRRRPRFRLSDMIKTVLKEKG